MASRPVRPGPPGGAGKEPGMSTAHARSSTIEQSTTRPPSEVAPMWLATRLLGALALLSVGAVHLQQYNLFYSAVPTIGPLFLVNFAAATGLGVALLAPLGRWTGRWGGSLVGLAAAGGVALAAGSFVMLAIAEQRPLFGFREPGYDPAAIAASRGAEIATVVLLGAY